MSLGSETFTTETLWTAFLKAEACIYSRMEKGTKVHSWKDKKITKESTTIWMVTSMMGCGSKTQSTDTANFISKKPNLSTKATLLIIEWKALENNSTLKEC